jgi:glycosyltransferase involved in cell wall biosynthesis
MEDSLVSCVIPTYKRNDTLGRAINSALNQTYKNIEILVIDDNEKGSEYSIKVMSIISEIDDVRVRYITQEKHINGAEARNAGIRAARGTWIAFLDDDDEWLPTKIEKQMAALSENLNVYGASCYYNEFIAGKLVHSCPPYNTDNLNFKIFTRQVAMYTPTLLLRKDKILEFGGFDNKLSRHQDLQLLVEFTHRNKMLVVEDYLVNVYGDSLINRPSLDRIIKVKNDYFNSVSSVFNTYSKRDRVLILCAHYYEVVFAAIRNKQYRMVFKYLLKAGIHPAAIIMLINRFKNKKYIANNS